MQDPFRCQSFFIIPKRGTLLTPVTSESRTRGPNLNKDATHFALLLIKDGFIKFFKSISILEQFVKFNIDNFYNTHIG